MMSVVIPKSYGEKALDWPTIRRDFPILNQEVNGRPLVFFDNAASSQRPRQVIEAVRRYYERDHANVHRGIHELSNRATAAYEGARERAAQFFNAASANEMVFVRGATEAINLVASSWGGTNLKPGDRILLTEMEHHSNLVPWQLIAQETGAEILWWPVKGDGECLDWPALDRLLTPSVKMLACAHISNSLGLINPVEEICRRARANGTISLVDGAQSTGHCPVDVQKIGCDFYVFSGHKMCAPTGIGGLYGREELLVEMPPYHGGGEMIEEVDYTGASFKPPPHRFEAGTPNIAGAVGLHKAMDYLDAIGRRRIFEHDAAIAAYACDQIQQLDGAKIYGPKGRRAAIVSFLLENIHAHDLVAYADRQGVALRGGHHCTQPLMKKLGVPGTARASFYFYNQHSEVDAMIDALQRAKQLFGNQ